MHCADRLLTILDTRQLLFDHVRFIVPGNKLVTTISGELTDNLQFINTVPQKPQNWKTGHWMKP